MTAIEDSPMGNRRQPGRSDVATHERLTIIDHPVSHDLLARLRDNRSGSAAFGAAAEELASHLLWEASRALPRQPTTAPGFTGAPVDIQRIAVAPAAVVILRAGEVFAPPFRRTFPAAPIFHVGVARDEHSLSHRVYSDHIPAELAGTSGVFILDPMLATGGSIVIALERVRASFDGDITIVAIVAAPLGVQTVLDADARVRIVTAALDDCLDENGYILPGLGDAGDRLFGTTG